MINSRAPCTRLRWGVSVVLPVLAACGGGLVGPGVGGEVLITDRVSYSAEVVDRNGSYTRYGFTLVAQFSNSTDEHLYLGRCEPGSSTPMYDIKAASTAVPGGSAYSPFWACTGHDTQFQVPPGESRTDTLRILGPSSWDGLTKVPVGELEGVVQLSYSVSDCRGACGEDTSRWVALSNVFRIALADSR